MEKILAKLEDMIVRFLDHLEDKPIRTLLLIVVLYYIFRVVHKREK